MRFGARVKQWAAGDEDMAEMAREELDELTKHLAQLEDHAKVLLLPKDPLDEKNIMLEVRECIPVLLPKPVHTSV